MGKLRWLLFAGALLLPGTAVWARYEPPPPCRNAFTREQEITEGAKVAAEVYKQMPVLPDSDPLSVYVAQLGAKLAAKAPGGAAAWPYNFHVVASPEINAFALPGGAMFVNVGAIRAAGTEAQLAGVMAHELSHVVLRHATCNITKEQRKSTWYGLGALASEVLLGNGAAGSLAVAGINGIRGMEFLHMSREDEMQADLTGANVLYDAGYDPRGLAQIFEIIEAKVGKGNAEWLSDHPNPGNRTRYVMDEIATLPPRPNAVVQTAGFRRAHDRAEGTPTFTAEDTKSGGWKTGNYAAGPGATTGTMTAVSAGRPVPGPGSDSARYLSDSELGLDGGFATYRGPGFAMDVPGNWTAAQSQLGGVTIAPSGGAGNFGLAYGAMVGLARTHSSEQLDTGALLRATRELVQRFTAGAGALQQASDPQPVEVGQRPGYSVELRGLSPVTEHGTSAPERDLLLTVARADGGVSYIVFVAPERDFGKVQPVFQSMAESFRALDLAGR